MIAKKTTKKEKKRKEQKPRLLHYMIAVGMNLLAIKSAAVGCAVPDRPPMS